MRPLPLTREPPYWDHGHPPSQATARPQSAPQADCGPLNRRDRRRALDDRLFRHGPRQEWWLEGREGARGKLDARASARNSATSSREAVGPKAAIAACDAKSYGNLLERQPRRGIDPVTVCIAARSFSSVFLVSDRMITAGDIQFEPPVEKIIFLTSSIAVMASGDSAFHTEVMKDVMKEVTDRVKSDPNSWVLVKDAVDLYIKYSNIAKLKRSEAAILAPLGLDCRSFIDNQKIMDKGLVESISRDMINFEIPDVTVIIAGLDMFMGQTNTHIYSINNNYISCDDIIGFRAIGSGARHAESHFMLARHAWNAHTHAALLLAYRAKKDSEVAPGVGAETDMFMIGPAVGQSSRMRPEIIEKLDREYRRMKRRHTNLQNDANEELKRYVDNLPAVAAGQADKPTPEDPEASSDAAPPSKPH
jgi:hypothetical protein